MLNEFKNMNIECFEPLGAFYVFPCIKEFNMTSEEFALKFLEEEKVAAVPGSAFGESGKYFIRVSYAYSMKKLETAIQLIKQFVDLRAHDRELDKVLSGKKGVCRGYRYSDIRHELGNPSAYSQ